ncbi:MAG: hypothetical protein CMF41_03465 [Legionellales bacterium]|nr:hypothetical protein [Legionellales bacterium]OUX65345.1 MAG: hypothetical protein CBE41_01880 [Gammaproteobacteria bacterium TMED281]
MSYESIFSAVLNIDPFTASVNDFQSIAYAKKLLIPEDVDELTVSDWQNFLFTFCVEPYLKRYPCAVVYDYPIAISSMARVSALDQEKAERFEIYLHGFECANGYAEIEYVEDYLKRCHVHNIYRKRKGLEEVQPDANFVHMIRDGFPACSGVSVGLDRVLLLLTESDAIGEVIARNVSGNSKSLKQVAA